MAREGRVAHLSKTCDIQYPASEQLHPLIDCVNGTVILAQVARYGNSGGPADAEDGGATPASGNDRASIFPKRTVMLIRIPRVV